MLIIEFNGLPGSGKTTLCNKLVEVLSTNEIVTLKDIVKVKNGNRTQNIINFITILFNYKFVMFNFRILCLTLEYGVKYDYFLFAARLIKLNGNLNYLASRHPKRIAILEEGFIQYITSIPHNKTINKSKNLEYVVDYILRRYQIEYIHCEIDEKVNHWRLGNRNLKGNRFDTLPQNELEEVLKIKYHNICMLRSLLDINSKSIVLDMAEDIEKNVDVIMSRFDIENRLIKLGGKHP